MGSVSTAARKRLGFESHSVRQLGSVAHLFPRSKGRRGVYILTFANGDRYAGQTVDVATRFAHHLRKVGDITTLEFARIPCDDLDPVEQDLIHTLQRRGERLRNKQHVLTSAALESASDLDLVVTPAEQHAWLDGDADIADIDGRVDDPERRAAGQARFDALTAHPIGSGAIAFARGYVRWALPRPRATEMTWWSASAMPATNRSTWPRLVTVSVNKMETFVAGWDRDVPDLMWGFLNVRKSTLEAEYGSIRAFVRARQDDLDVEEAGYEAGGGDVARIHVADGFAFEELLTATENDGVITAAASLALLLMRKGPTLQWRAHNFALADELVRPLPDSG